MAQREITKVDFVSTAKVLGLMYGVIGFVLGLLVTLLGVGTPTASLGVLGILLLPIFYGILGVIVGAITSLLYNFVVKYTEGIKVEVK